MRARKWLSVSLILLVAALACDLPFIGPDIRATETVTNVQVAAAQTIAAQQSAAASTDLASGADVTATASAQAGAATQTALSAESTLLAGAANATATSQALAVTVAAQDLQATALSQAQTATAQAFSLPPPPPPPGNMIRISFDTGATSANVDGQIRKDQVIDYVLRALKNQTMLVSVYSPNDNVYLGIVGLSDGVPLIRTSAAGTSFTGVLPNTQDYRITLYAPVQQNSYTLQVIIPARIQFAPGAISATLQGFLKGGNVNYYLARAFGGQEMSVSIFSPGSDIFLTIYGMEDGSPLVRSVMAQTSWSGTLPATQDYMIHAVSTGASANYSLQVTIQ